MALDSAKLGRLIEFWIHGWDIVSRRRLEEGIIAQSPFDVKGLCIFKEAKRAAPHVVNVKNRQVTPCAESFSGLCESNSRIEPVEGAGAQHCIKLLTRQGPRFKRAYLNLSVRKPFEVSPGESGKLGTELYRHEAHTELSQWDAELPCAATNLQNATASEESRRCNNRVYHLWRVWWAVQIIVLGDDIK